MPQFGKEEIANLTAVAPHPSAAICRAPVWRLLFSRGLNHDCIIPPDFNY